MIPHKPLTWENWIADNSAYKYVLEKGGPVSRKYENVVCVWGEFHSYLQVYSIK